MALNDTSYIQAADTVNTLQTSNAVVRNYRKTTERGYVTAPGLESPPQVSRNRTIITREWLAVSKAAAIQAVDDHAGDTNQTFAMRETNQVLGAAVFVQQVDSVTTDWA